MPLMLSVYNATLEDRKIQFNSKAYRFPMRSITKLPEDLAFALDQYAKFGLVFIKPGDDLKAKETEALKNYLAFLNERIAYFNMYLDEKKRNGVTIETPRDLAKLTQWKKEIEARLEMDGELESVPSFKDFATPDGKALFQGELEIKEVKEIAKKRGRPATSFSEVDIEKEVSN